VEAKHFAKKMRRQSKIAKKLANSEISQTVARKLIGKLRDREGMAAIGKMFEEFDTDHSGRISPDEFAEGLHAFGMDLVREEVNALFALIDLDGDGDLELEEFMEFVKGQFEVIQFEEAHGADGGRETIVKALHGGTRFQRTGSVLGDVTKQGDIEMLSEGAKKMREHLKENGLVVKSINLWWNSLRGLSEHDRTKINEKKRTDRRSSVAELENGGYILAPGLSKKQFITMMRSMHQLLEPDDNDLAEDELDRDWDNDRTIDEAYAGEYMGFDEFYSSVFELCDLWIDGLGMCYLYMLYLFLFPF
jgi:hypothetical protein